MTQSTTTTSTSRAAGANCDPASAVTRSLLGYGVIAGPLYGDEGIVTAECDLRVGLHAKRWFDVVGHYSREDVLAPAVSNGDLQVRSAPRSAGQRDPGDGGA